MNRRGFLSGLITAGLSAAVDPGRLLWVPGQKTIFIPPHLSVRPPLIFGLWRVAEFVALEGNIILGRSRGGLGWFTPSQILVMRRRGLSFTQMTGPALSVPSARPSRQTGPSSFDALLLNDR